VRSGSCAAGPHYRAIVPVVQPQRGRAPGDGAIEDHPHQNQSHEIGSYQALKGFAFVLGSPPEPVATGIGVDYIAVSSQKDAPQKQVRV
jgi:hypothetical protein